LHKSKVGKIRTGYDGFGNLVAQTGRSPQRAIRSELVVVTGLAVKSVFVVIAWWGLNALSRSGGLLYAWGFLGIGAFLTGLIVGYLMKRKDPAVSVGFLCALVPTLVFSAIAGQGSRAPIGWLIFVFLFAPVDVLAAISAIFGRSAKPRMFGVAALIVLILLALVSASIYIVAPTVHYGDITLTGNQTMTIEMTLESSRYEQHGNISLSGNASMTISGGEFDMMQDGSMSHLISLSGDSKMNFKDSTLNRVSTFGSTGSASVILYDNANLTLERSAILGYTLISYNSSTMLLLDSILQSPTSAHGTSTITVSGSTYQSWQISGYEHSQINVTGSDTGVFYGYGHSDLMMTNSKSLGLLVSEMSHQTVTNSRIYKVAAEGFRGSIVFSGTNVTDGMTVDDLSDFYMSGTVAFTPLPSFESNGTVTRNYDVGAAPNIQLNVTNSETHALLLQTTSSATGTASFDIAFTAVNYTNTCLLNEKPFSLASTTPLIYP